MNLEEKIDDLINNKFPLIYKLDNKNVYLIGGSIKSIILDEISKDLDFVYIIDTDEKIKSFINKYNLPYKKNSFNGYKINYNNINIDLWNTKDLEHCVEYNYDQLFYDINKRKIIDIGFTDAIKNGIKEVNCNIKNNRINGIDEEKLNKRLEKIKLDIKRFGDKL